MDREIPKGRLTYTFSPLLTNGIHMLRSTSSFVLFLSLPLFFLLLCLNVFRGGEGCLCICNKQVT